MSKRACDFMGAVVLLVVLAPVLLGLALLVRVALGSPVLFRQLRPGLGARPFTLLKFRTMLPARAGRESDAERLTRFGRWLRGSSLDELPELLNILRGDMSFVGPRPLLMDYLHLYDARQRRRHDVRPGLTGWAQVMGRNTLDWPTRLELDVWYVEHHTAWLDVRILLKTVFAVVRRSGVTQAGHSTVEKFRGT